MPLKSAPKSHLLSIPHLTHESIFSYFTPTSFSHSSSFKMILASTIYLCVRETVRLQDVIEKSRVGDNKTVKMGEHCSWHGKKSSW